MYNTYIWYILFLYVFQYHFISDCLDVVRTFNSSKVKISKKNKWPNSLLYIFHFIVRVREGFEG